MAEQPVPLIVSAPTLAAATKRVQPKLCADFNGGLNTFILGLQIRAESDK